VEISSAIREKNARDFLQESRARFVCAAFESDVVPVTK
jgi:hypothetical protein